jgi:hypothetical protein
MLQHSVLHIADLRRGRPFGEPENARKKWFYLQFVISAAQSDAVTNAHTPL